MFISMNKIEVTWKLDPTFISLRIVLLFTGNSEFHHFGVFKPVIKILAIGQLISKCLFGASVWTKIATKIL